MRDNRQRDVTPDSTDSAAARPVGRPNEGWDEFGGEGGDGSGPDHATNFYGTGTDDLRAGTRNDPRAGGPDVDPGARTAQGNHGNTGFGTDDDHADPDDAKVTGQSRE